MQSRQFQSAAQNSAAAFALSLVMLLGGALAAPQFDRLQAIAASRYGEAGSSAVRAWRAMLRDAETEPDDQKLKRVNDFFNRRLRFIDDVEVWGEADYWATPLETLGRGAGDCEDFSIAKYVTLKALGIPEERMRLIYVRAQLGGPYSRLTQAHMVLGYYSTPNDEPVILDNLISEIRPAATRTDLFPIFSFNAQGLWVGGGNTPAASPTERLSRWRDVLNRMREEGIE
ncbi:MAG: transglutaminase-like cysteine peptidase [Rhodocyclaceae bacterium]|nr:transglutaminase-like cysteine peptidase [Rhodocyclaceae bacterium]MCP5308583.1 transglutaminase-like cysteine peptidase [Zoogloeaceae bacterium]